MKTIKGYKAFYKDQNDKLFTEPDAKRLYFEVGINYKVDNDKAIEIGYNGFHFCKTILDLLNYYPFSQSVVYCEVEGTYNGGRNFDANCCHTQLCTREIKICKKLTFEEVLDLLSREIIDTGVNNHGNDYNSNVLDDSQYITNSSVISSSNCVENSEAVLSSNYITDSKAINISKNIFRSEAVNSSQAILRADAINYGRVVIDSSAISNAAKIIDCSCVDGSFDIVDSRCIFESERVYNSQSISKSYFVIESEAINNSDFISNCRSLSRCFFCFDLLDNSFCMFNKQVDKEYIANVRETFKKIIEKVEWKPHITNGQKIIGNRQSLNSISLFDFHQLDESDYFNDMPKKAIEYLKSLPEFDAKIFEKITNIKIGG